VGIDEGQADDGGGAAAAGGGADPPPDGRPSRRRGWLRSVAWVGLGAIALFAVIQIIPYGRSHSNPPVAAEPSWDAPRTRVLFEQACGDCHSNETTWPWYSNVAPVSWLVQNDVDGGRSHLNVSEWDRPQEAAGDVVEQIEGGGMPPSYYTWMHSSAKLSPAEKQELIRGWQATIQASPPIAGG
jgi:mono/diheme cytochrome c family protein